MPHGLVVLQELQQQMLPGAFSELNAPRNHFLVRSNGFPQPPAPGTWGNPSGFHGVFDHPVL